MIGRHWYHTANFYLTHSTIQSYINTVLRRRTDLSQNLISEVQIWNKKGCRRGCCSLRKKSKPADINGLWRTEVSVVDVYSPSLKTRTERLRKVTVEKDTTDVLVLCQ